MAYLGPKSPKLGKFLTQCVCNAEKEYFFESSYTGCLTNDIFAFQLEQEK